MYYNDDDPFISALIATGMVMGIFIIMHFVIKVW